MGNVVSGLLGFLLTGNQSFNVKVYSPTNSQILNANSDNPVTFGTESIRVVQNLDGHYYLVITPTQAYKKIRITNMNISVIGAMSEKYLRVWDPYTVTSPSACNYPKFTSFDGAGLNLDLLGIGGGNGNYPNAVDNNMGTHSMLSTGLLSVGAIARQLVYFEGPSTPGDVFNIQCALNTSAISINLGQWLKIKTYNGNNLVTDQFLNQILTTQQMTSFLQGNSTLISIVPGGPVDRVVIEVTSVINVNINLYIKIFEVWKSPTAPTLNAAASDTTVCEGTSATLVVNANDPAHQIRWYVSATASNHFATSASGAPFITGILQNDTTFYFTAAAIGCPYQSLRTPVSIDVTPAPSNAGLVLNPLGQYCAIDTVVLTGTAPNGININWHTSQTSTTPIQTGPSSGNYSYIAGNDTLQIYDLSTSDSPLTVYGTIQDSVTGCWGLPGTYIPAVINIIDEPTPTTTVTSPPFCLIDDMTVSDIVVSGTNVIWYDTVVAGTPLPSTTILQAGNTYYAASVGSTCESSVRLPITPTIVNEPAPTAQDALQSFCELDSAKVSDLVASPATVNWYDSLGNLLTSSSPLATGLYYARTQGATCESDDSLAIQVIIDDLPAPTAQDSVQYFCPLDNPTIADIAIDNTTVTWYDAAGNALPTTTPLTDSTSYFAAMVSPNCESLNRLEIAVLFVDQHAIEFHGDTTNVCLMDSYLYTLPGGMTNYQWTITGGTFVSGGTTTDSFAHITWHDSINPTLSVAYDVPGGCTISSSTPYHINTIICANLTITKTVDDNTPFIGEEVVFTISAINNSVINVHDVVLQEIIQSGFTYVSHISTSGNYDPATGLWYIPTIAPNSTEILSIRVTVNPLGEYFNIASIFSVGDSIYDPQIPGSSTSPIVELDPHCLIIYNEFSPNGDGVNDYFLVDCIERYPRNELKIFNRFGNEIYSVTVYKNDWDGYSNVKGVVGKGEKLPTGTYYFILKIESEDFEKAGWLYIVH